jgi:hypothetical protein
MKSTHFVIARPHGSSPWAEGPRQAPRQSHPGRVSPSRLLRFARNDDKSKTARSRLPCFYLSPTGCADPRGMKRSPSTWSLRVGCPDRGPLARNAGGTPAVRSARRLRLHALMASVGVCFFLMQQHRHATKLSSHRVQVLIAGPQFVICRQPGSCQKMGVDIADAAAEQFFAIDKPEHLLVRGYDRLRDWPSVRHRARLSFAFASTSGSQHRICHQTMT